MADAPLLRVTLAWSPAPRQVQERVIVVPAGATVLQAVQASGIRSDEPALPAGSRDFGIWGRKVGPEQVLRDGDRVEIYRALRVDPKVARRERFVRQGARSAGLFAKKRAGSDPAG